MSERKPRRLRVRRPEPPPKLIDAGEAGIPSAVPSFAFSSDASEPPLLLARVGPVDLDAAARAISGGARPTALVTGIGELPAITSAARRRAQEADLPWLTDPLLFKTALPGYRTAKHLQTLDYTPGRDAEPYQPDEFTAGFARTVGRTVVGAQHDIGASGAYSGGFVIADPEDAWLQVSCGVLDAAIAARDAYGGRLPIFGSVSLKMSGFMALEAQAAVVAAYTTRRPDGYVLSLDGLAPDSGVERLVAALRLALLLQATGAPVIVSRVGPFRPFFASFGVRGIEFGLGRLMRFSVPDYASKGGPGQSPPHFEVPSLLSSLPARIAVQALGRGVLPEDEPDCPACEALATDRARVAGAAEHDLHAVCHEAGEEGGVDVGTRVERLRTRAEAAEWRWLELAADGVPLGEPKRLRTVRAAVTRAVESGLLEPVEVARDAGLEAA